MVAKLSTEEFVSRANARHGEKYDYSASEYKNATTKLTIICPEHGPWVTSPSNHLSGRGCPSCGRQKNHESLTSTTQRFVEKARKLHGDKYNYGKTKYVNSKTKVLVTCRIHGDWLVVPSSHLHKKTKPGCPKCKAEKAAERILLDEPDFIRRSQQLHGDKYDYSRVKYLGSAEKVEIICPIHGAFWQAAVSHMTTGLGCAKCSFEARGIAQRKSLDEFVQAARKVHGNKYSYDKAQYINNETKLIITCREHGDFEQSPAPHISQMSGCPQCAHQFPLDTERFIELVRRVHGDAYRYDKTDYANIHSKVVITCPEHGDFTQQASAHKRGQGCPSCAKTGFDPTRPGRLYYLRINDRIYGALYKIGITNRSVAERFKLRDLDKISLLRRWQFENGQSAFDFERRVLTTYVDNLYRGKEVLSSGNSEIFSSDVLGLDPESAEQTSGIVREIVIEAVEIPISGEECS